MNNKEFNELFPVLDEYVKTHVSERRYKHIQGVVKASEKYAKKYGADVNDAKISAIFHDACKEEVKGLEHGLAASNLLRDKFGVENEDILLAIANHTVGRPNMCLLEKIMKLSDLLEEGRTYDDVAQIREYEENHHDIDRTCLMLAERQKIAILRENLPYDDRNDLVIDWLKKIINKNMTNKDIAILAASELDKRKALDISIIDISEKSGFADYFVIASVSSLRQLSAAENYVEDRLAKEDILVHHVEGQGDSGWILMDYGDVVINLFTVEQRDHYNLEKVWSDCIAIDFEPIKEEEN